MENKKVGVVIIGRNEGERLILCLESVLLAKVPCVYVDSQSKDKSVYESEQRQIRTVVLDHSAPINASRARNTGFDVLIEENPELEYVHFIDADCELDKDWLKYAIEELESSEDVAIVCGRLHEKYKYKNIYTRLCDMDWYIPPGEILACGGIFTMRRSVFNKMKGFNESLIAGADPELCFRVREAEYKIICLPVDMGTHDSNMKFFSQNWKRSIKTGYAYMSRMLLGGKSQPVISAFIWGIVLPIFILLSIFIDIYFVLLSLVYPVQVLRIYLRSARQPFPAYSRVLYSIFCVLGKFSEFIGIMKFIFNVVLRLDQRIIEYKAK